MNTLFRRNDAVEWELTENAKKDRKNITQVIINKIMTLIMFINAKKKDLTQVLDSCIMEFIIQIAERRYSDTTVQHLSTKLLNGYRKP